MAVAAAVVVVAISLLYVLCCSLLLSSFPYYCCCLSFLPLLLLIVLFICFYLVCFVACVYQFVDGLNLIRCLLLLGLCLFVFVGSSCWLFVVCDGCRD